jgi:hypothetical protein
MEEHTYPITAKQADMIAGAQDLVNNAMQQAQLIINTVLAGVDTKDLEGEVSFMGVRMENDQPVIVLRTGEQTAELVEV